MANGRTQRLESNPNCSQEWVLCNLSAQEWMKKSWLFQISRSRLTWQTDSKRLLLWSKLQAARGPTLTKLKSRRRMSKMAEVVQRRKPITSQLNRLNTTLLLQMRVACLQLLSIISRKLLQSTELPNQKSSNQARFLFWTNHLDSRGLSQKSFLRRIRKSLIHQRKSDRRTMTPTEE